MPVFFTFCFLLYLGEFQTYTNRVCIQTYNLHVHYSRTVFLELYLASISFQISQRVCENRMLSSTIYSLRLKYLGWNPEFAFLTSSLVLQMLPLGNHTLRNIVYTRQNGEGNHYWTATMNNSYPISFHMDLLPSLSSRWFSRKYQKSSYLIAEYFTT